MDLNLAGRRVLVTGIGGAIAAAFVREGAAVAVHARTIEQAATVVDRLGETALPVAADLADPVPIPPLAPMTTASKDSGKDWNILLGPPGPAARGPYLDTSVPGYRFKRVRNASRRKESRATE